MAQIYEHLGVYSDWVTEAKCQSHLYPLAKPGRNTINKLRKALGFTKGKEMPDDVRIEASWEKDGVKGEQISWWTGYGPRTQAWLLRPDNNNHPIPGIIALHDHGGFKYFGKEKIAEGIDSPHPALLQHREAAYGGRAYANELALQGFAVLVHDTFLWGSRRFPIQDIPPQDRNNGLRLVSSSQHPTLAMDEIVTYNSISGLHEYTVEKYCNLLGTTLAGVVSHEDRMALNYFASRSDVCPNQIGCIGLSGGGNRAALLLATSEVIKAAVVVGLMSTYEALLDHNVISHTWMLFPPGWSRFGDWPDIAASRSPMPLLVQYNNEDELFTLQGMKDAHQRITFHYQNSKLLESYLGQFYPGFNKFDKEMQENAFRWLKSQFQV
jgi:dienelactone hydrolase